MPEVALPTCAQRHRSWKERDRLLVDQPRQIVAEALGCRSGVELPVRQRLLDQARLQETCIRDGARAARARGCRTPCARGRRLPTSRCRPGSRDRRCGTTASGGGPRRVGSCSSATTYRWARAVLTCDERAHPGPAHRRADAVLERLTEWHGEPNLANPSPSVSQRSGLGLRRRRRYALGVAVLLR